MALQIQITDGNLTLADLRDLVEHTVSWDGSSAVVPRGGESPSITVSQPESERF